MININLHDAILIDIKFNELYKGNLKLIVEAYLDQVNDKNRAKIELLFSKIKKFDISLEIDQLIENRSAGNIDIVKKFNNRYIIVLFGGYMVIETEFLDIRTAV
jgi:hypothetical protein